MQTKTKRQLMAELAASDRTTVGSSIASQVLGCDQWGLVLAAKNGHLDYLPHFFSGNRLHISKAALLKFCGWEEKS